MASPQVEKGFLKLANELLEAILAYKGLTGIDMKLIFFVIRRTYGWNQLKAQLSYGEVARECKVDRAGVMKSLNRLQEHNILFVQHTAGKRNSNIVGINKNYDQWKNNVTKIGWED